MDKLFQSIKSSATSVLVIACLSSPALSFELLTEGAMGSVSALSANSADELMSAGAPAAGIEIDDEYERLPFQARISLEGYQPEVDAQEELEFDLTKEIEAWAGDLRDRFDSEFEVNVVDSLPETLFPNADDVVIELDLGDDIVIDIDDLEEIDTNQTLYLIGRIDQEVNLIEAGVNTVTFEVRRVVEQIRTENQRPFLDGPAIGSTYLTDLQARSRVVVTDRR